METEQWILAEAAASGALHENMQAATFQKGVAQELEAWVIPPPAWEQAVSFTSAQCSFTDTIFKGHFLLDVVNR